MSRLYRQFALLFALWGCLYWCTEAHASTITYTKDTASNGQTAHVEVTFSCGGGSYTWSRTHGDVSGHHYDGCVYLGVGGSPIFDISHTGALNGSGTFSCTVGQAVSIYTAVLEGSTELAGGYESHSVPQTADSRRFDLSNTEDFTVKYKFLNHSTGATIDTVTVDAMSQKKGVLIPVPCGVTVDVLYQADNREFVDGQWEYVPDVTYTEPVTFDSGAVTGPVTGTATGGPAYTSDPAAGTGTIVDNASTTDNKPNASDTATIWKPDSSTDALTKAVYKEGVEKQLAELKKLQGVTGNTTGGNGTATETTLAAIKTVLDVSGTAPSTWGNVTVTGAPSASGNFTTVSENIIPSSFSSYSPFSGNITVNVKTITYNGTVPAMLGKAAIPIMKVIDLEEFDTAIGTFRAVCSGVVWFLFFILIVKTTKGIGAGK